MQKYISWSAVILWMLLIFYFSQQAVDTSNDLSSGITKRIVEAVQIVAPNNDMSAGMIHHIIRKNAHFFIYFFLGMFVYIALKKHTMKSFKKERIAFYICILYAISDEVHQLFVAGRDGQVRDVLIDSMGAASGIILASVISSLVKSKKRLKEVL